MITVTTPVFVDCGADVIGSDDVGTSLGVDEGGSELGGGLELVGDGVEDGLLDALMVVGGSDVVGRETDADTDVEAADSDAELEKSTSCRGCK